MRQLAAILFADMAGYTSIMQDNEQLARTKRKRLKEVLNESMSKYNGKILQNYGDGSLSIFFSATDSVECAIDIQRQLKQDPKVDLRIGIHTGDIVMEDEAVFGDGVNLASRIESLAVPGGIFVSEKVYEEIRNHDNLIAKELGYFELKNVREPVRVFAIANDGIVVPAREEIRGKLKQKGNRLAVLPFVNMSADPDNEYFSDGITEELLNALTKVDGLQVTSRTSAFAFKGKDHDIRDIAIQLNVDKVLEGSVRKSGNRVRITAQLINAADGYHIWSENYDRNLTDIFEVQDEISGIIANKLRENFSVNVKEEHFVKKPTDNLTAYTYYLKGLHFWNKMTPSDMFKSIEYFERAISIEPDYAAAYAMTAGAYSYLGATGQTSPQKAFRIVHQYADKAIELDNTLASGYISKGSAYLFYEWQWQKAYDALKKGIELNPGAISAYELLSFYYIIIGKKEEAVRIMEDAVKIDPLSSIVIQSLGNKYIFVERFDDAIAEAEKLLEMDPQMRVALEIKAWSTGMKGDWHAALEIFQEIYRLTNHPLKGLMGLGFAYTRLGETEKAMECVHKLEQRLELEPETVVEADLAAIWFGLGNLDKCFYYINRCIDKRMGPATYFLEYPAYKGVKDDPRYQQIVERTMRERIEVSG